MPRAARVAFLRSSEAPPQTDERTIVGARLVLARGGELAVYGPLRRATTRVAPTAVAGAEGNPRRVENFAQQYRWPDLKNARDLYS